MIEEKGTMHALPWRTRVGAALLSGIAFVLALLLTGWILEAPDSTASSFGVFCGVLTLGLGFVGVNLLRAALMGDRDGFSVIRDGVQDYCALFKRGSTRALATGDESGAERASLESR